MSAWRRRALRLFPSLRSDLNDREYTVYLLFFDLLPMVLGAHDSGDVETLRRIYGFAEWCFSQRDGDLHNAAGVAFYEHLFDDERYWPLVVPWLSPGVIHECWQLWELRLPSDQVEGIRKLIDARKEALYRNLEFGDADSCVGGSD